ncbi:SusC/RagA family TonB-linked outer membrane protein [Ancylomarina sp. YFZ004]
MKKSLFSMLILCLIGLQSVFAQSREVSGVVTSAEDGLSIPGVSIIVKGTTIGTSTDFDGKYTISVPADGKFLIFSSVGMKKIEVAIASNVINMVMESESVGMDEVIVVAYGTKNKRAITGAITSVGADVLENQIAVSPISAIQGAAPGVNILTSGGQPGENPTIRIRGVGSVNASADPLIVVDGVVFSGNLNSISSSQIETINVLKDASASALYGSRASNGVILITTKSGKYVKKDATISINARAGVSNAAVDLYDYVGSEDYMKYSWESIRNGELPDNATAADYTTAGQTATNNLITTLGYNPYDTANPVGADGQIVAGANLKYDSDWYDALSNDNAFYNEYDLSVSGSSDNVVYFINGNYLKQEGAIIESEFERYSGRINLKAKLRDWMEMGTNTSFSKSIQNYPNQAGNSYTSIMQWANSVANIYPIYQRDANGDLKFENGSKMYDYGNASGQAVNAVRPVLGGENAVSSSLINEILYTRSNLFSSTFLKIDLHKNLSFRTNFGYERYVYDSNEYDHYKFGSASSVGGRVSQQRTITETTTITNSLNYKKDFEDHSIAVDVISEMYDYNYDRMSAQGTGFLPGVKVMSGSTLPESVGGYVNSERLESYMARVDYNYKQRYFLDFSARRDGSSRFAEDNRWGTFYSIGANWILSDENFMKSFADKIDLLKIRGSYGELGNNRGIGYFPYYAAYDTGWNNGENTGVLQGGIVDQNIKWEKTALFNVAIDYGFFNNRVTGSVEYYSKEAIDLLFDMPLPSSTGNTAVTTNIGTVKNSGFEFIVNTVNVHTDDVYWTSTFNISTNKNELTKLPQEEIINGTKKWKVGKSMYDFFIRDYAGVDEQTGEALWLMDVEDAEGNVTQETTNDYNEADRYYQGSSLPDFTGGFGSYFKYKNFDLNVQFNFSVGGQLYDYSYAGLMGSLDRPGRQLHVDIKDRWQKPGDITNTPKLTTEDNDYNGTSTRFLFDNDYLRMKALTIGYNLPESLLKKTKLSKCRFYFQADNLLTFSTIKGIDPEQSLAGTTDSRSNIMKTVSVGVNIEF